ncbi:MAG: hypothetical protein C0505_10950 [Leptothrix sp. (in: Bacteria)]|nr:hypothetical protein [Leptothrix sp. (in: b-proteobacteria)]
MGVEIVAGPVAQSRDNARRAGVAARTRFEVQGLFATDLAAATVVTMYPLPEVNLALRPRRLGATGGGVAATVEDDALCVAAGGAGLSPGTAWRRAGAQGCG